MKSSLSVTCGPQAQVLRLSLLVQTPARGKNRRLLPPARRLSVCAWSVWLDARPAQEDIMSTENLTIAFTVNSPPEEVFAAITNVRGWWSGEIDGRTDELGAEFTYRYEDVHRSTQRISELIPGKRVAWHVVDGYLAFVEDKAEWTGTD